MPEQTWSISIAFTEDDDRTRADAVLELASETFHAVGRARRSPSDPSIPVIGEELAAARALADLSHQMLQAAADRIEDFEGYPVKVRG